MSGRLNGATRLVVAVVLGVLGVMLIVSTTVVVVTSEEGADLSGVREAFLVIVGSLLVLGGASLATIVKGSPSTTQEPPS